MKKLILIAGILVCMAAAHFVFGQAEGTITYTTKVNMHRTLPADRPEMKNMIPEYNTFRSKLAFKNSESYYTSIEEDNEDEFGSDGTVNLKIRRPKNDFYFNHSSYKRIVAREFFGKHFLIEDSASHKPWKLDSDTKVIQGITCRKAVWTNMEGNQNVVAWYAETLPPFLGPEDFTGLPGTVLEIDINQGERVIMVEKIEMTRLHKGDLIIPSRGQKITESEFRKMMEEHRKKMGGQGNVMIRN